MIEKKHYLKTKPVCKVTFKVTAKECGNAEHVAITGSFNAWNEASNPMKKAADGSFSVTLDLEAGKEHEFRYLADGKRWFNEKKADKKVTTPFGSENSVLVL